MSQEKLIIPSDNYTREQIEELKNKDYNPSLTEYHLEHYGEFLQEDDFEIRMAAAHKMQPGSIEQLELNVRIAESEIRTLWLKKGAVTFASKQWGKLHNEYVRAHMQLRLHKAILEKNRTGSYTMQKPKWL